MCVIAIATAATATTATADSTAIVIAVVVVGAPALLRFDDVPVMVQTPCKHEQ
jgi:hypothetical protein